MGGVSCPPGRTKTGRGGRRGQLPHTRRNPQLRKGLGRQIAPQHGLAALPHTAQAARNPRRPEDYHDCAWEGGETWLEGSGSPADAGPHRLPGAAGGGTLAFLPPQYQINLPHTHPRVDTSIRAPTWAQGRTHVHTYMHRTHGYT